MLYFLTCYVHLTVTLFLKTYFESFFIDKHACKGFLEDACLNKVLDTFFKSSNLSVDNMALFISIIDKANKVIMTFPHYLT